MIAFLRLDSSKNSLCYTSLSRILYTIIDKIIKTLTDNSCERYFDTIVHNYLGLVPSLQDDHTSYLIILFVALSFMIQHDLALWTSSTSHVIKCLHYHSTATIALWSACSCGINCSPFTVVFILLLFDSRFFQFFFRVLLVTLGSCSWH